MDDSENGDMPPVVLFDPPAAGFENPFAMLDACHDRVRRSLDLLQRLNVHVQVKGVDEPARSAARDVLRYFTRAAPQHHEDEERHVVPALRATADAAAHDAADRLLREHAAIRTAWTALEPALRAIEAGHPPPSGLREAACQFADLHDGHLRFEEDVAFPLAAAVLSKRGGAELTAMGDEMARRRGVAPVQRVGADHLAQPNSSGRPSPS
jgi:hemerythrin-like domain-containing protein